MTDFLLFVDDLRRKFPVHVDIYYSKTMDWSITVYKKGCVDRYPKSPRAGSDVILAAAQDVDMELCFAKAHVLLKNWLRNFEGGY